MKHTPASPYKAKNFPLNRRRALIGLAFGLCASVMGLPHAQAQELPDKPIRLVVAYSPGGSIDLAARRIADDMGAILGRQVVVENRVGANGVIAADNVARSTPDGTSILFTTLPAHAGNHSAYKSLPYDTIKDFAPITVLSVTPLVLVATPSLPANTLPELIQLAKDKPGEINYASFGVGGMAHLAGVQMNLIAGTNMTHVPYKGGGPAMADVVGGHADLYFSGLATALPYIKDGRLKPIAVSTKERVDPLPDIPTLSETPGFEDFEAVVTSIMLAPAGTPPAIVDKLHAAALKATQTEKYRKALEAAGEGAPRAVPPQEAKAMLEKEVERLAVLFKAAGIKPE